jgi:hypothetical protein
MEFRAHAISESDGPYVPILSDGHVETQLRLEPYLPNIVVL